MIYKKLFYKFINYYRNNTKNIIIYYIANLLKTQFISYFFS